MNTNEIEDFLIGKGVKPTANRILVARELFSVSHPVSLSDIEHSIDTMDKSSIFRVLELLADKEVIHVIEDGTRSLKYEICHNHGHHNINDQHIHFYCERCRETFCLEDINVPIIKLPAGFRSRAVNYLVKGICPKCNESN